MKKYLLILLVVIFGLYMFGCGKKQAPEEMEAISLEALTNVTAPSPAPSESKVVVPKSQLVPATSQPAAKLEPLPPAGPYKPSAIEIQTALKSAGYYSGNIDGKIGPMTKKAVEEFQKENNLKVDGKVGPKTWEVLKSHLVSEPAVPAKAKKKR